MARDEELDRVEEATKSTLLSDRSCDVNRMMRQSYSLGSCSPLIIAVELTIERLLITHQKHAPSFLAHEVPTWSYVI